MGLKRLNIKIKPFYLPTKIVDIWDFNPSKLEINKEGSDEIGTFYLTIDDNIFSYVECNDESKYLNLVFCTEYEDVKHLKYIEIWKEIKTSINKLTHSKFNDFNKDYKVIKFDSDDVLSLDKTIKIKSLAVVIKSVLESDGGYYPQRLLV